MKAAAAAAFLCAPYEKAVQKHPQVFLNHEL
jgi:uncharacterized Zn-finger protein